MGAGAPAAASAEAAAAAASWPAALAEADPPSPLTDADTAPLAAAASADTLAPATSLRHHLSEAISTTAVAYDWKRTFCVCVLHLRMQSLCIQDVLKKYL